MHMWQQASKGGTEYLACNSKILGPIFMASTKSGRTVRKGPLTHFEFSIREAHGVHGRNTTDLLESMPVVGAHQMLIRNCNSTCGEVGHCEVRNSLPSPTVHLCVTTPIYAPPPGTYPRNTVIVRREEEECIQLIDFYTDSEGFMHTQRCTESVCYHFDQIYLNCVTWPAPQLRPAFS